MNYANYIPLNFTFHRYFLKRLKPHAPQGGANFPLMYMYLCKSKNFFTYFLLAPYEKSYRLHNHSAIQIQLSLTKKKQNMFLHPFFVSLTLLRSYRR